MRLFTFLLLCLVFLGIPAAQGNTDSLRFMQTGVFKRAYTKSINKLFQVDDLGELSIDNRFGDIDYKVWDRNEVKISILIEVDATSESRANEVFDRIDINFASGRSAVSAKTEISSKGGTFWWNKGDGAYSINYVISAPKGWDVDFTNSYGDVRTPDLDKDAKLDIRYGDLFTGDIAGSTDLFVSYGNAHLGKLQYLDATYKYADIEIKSATLTTINSKYSETSIKRLKRLRLDSQYDEFVIGSVREFVNAGRYDDFQIDSAWSVRLDSRYTEIKINYLAEDLDVSIRYGDAYIGGTAPQLSSMLMKGEYTDFTVRINPNVRYSVEAKGRYSDIDFPSTMKMLRKENVGSTSNYEGSIGANPKAKIVMSTSYGSIDIK